MKILVKFTHGTTHHSRIIEGVGNTPEEVLDNYIENNCLAQDGCPTSFGRNMGLGDITDITEVSKALSTAEYATTGKEVYFRSPYNHCWYNVKVEGYDNWWQYAHYSDDELLERGAKPVY